MKEDATIGIGNVNKPSETYSHASRHQTDGRVGVSDQATGSYGHRDRTGSLQDPSNT